MNLSDKTYIYNRVKKHYNYIKSLGYDILFCAAQGSMNYNLYIYDNEYKSDVDTKCVIIPKLENLIKGDKVVSKKYDFEGEQIDVKDIRLMIEMWKKQNPSYLELLFTDFIIINENYKKYIEEILLMKDEISHMNENMLIRSVYGMAKDKNHALKHPYPNIVEKIEKFGYDPKQFASTIRLAHLAKKFFIDKCDFKESIYYNNNISRNYLLNVKKGIYSLDFAEKMMETYLYDIEYIKNKVIENKKDEFNSKTYNRLQEIAYHLIYDSILKHIEGEISNE